MKKNILMMLDCNINTVGGAQISTKVILENLKKNYNFILIMPGKKNYNLIKNNLLIKNIEFYPSILRNPYGFIKTVLKIKNKIENLKIDLVHAQMLSSYLMIVFIKIFFKNDLKIIYTDRGFYSDYNIFYRMVLKFLIKTTEKVVTTTNQNKDYWLGLGKQVDKIELIYNTTSNEFENCIFEKKMEKIVTISLVGRFVDAKDWPLALKILKCLPNKNKIRVKIAVGLPEKKMKGIKDEAEHEKYILFKRELETIKDFYKIEFFENLKLDEMVHFFEETDLLLITSKYESFGRVAVEAMSQKCCIIARKTGGLKEVVGVEECLFEKEEEAVNKVDLIINNSCYMRQLGEAFYKRYIELYSVKSNVENYNKLYKTLNREKF